MAKKRPPSGKPNLDTPLCRWCNKPLMATGATFSHEAPECLEFVEWREEEREETRRDRKDRTVTLNAYQRANLLWLLGLVGYPHDPRDPGIFPFTLANTGDWVGEAYALLGGFGDKPDYNPNRSKEEMRADVARALRPTPTEGKKAPSAEEFEKSFGSLKDVFDTPAAREYLRTLRGESEPPAAGPWVRVKERPPEAPCAVLVWAGRPGFLALMLDNMTLQFPDLHMSCQCADVRRMLDGYGITHWAPITPLEAK